MLRLRRIGRPRLRESLRWAFPLRLQILQPRAPKTKSTTLLLPPGHTPRPPTNSTRRRRPTPRNGKTPPHRKPQSIRPLLALNALTRAEPTTRHTPPQRPPQRLPPSMSAIKPRLTAQKPTAAPLQPTSGGQRLNKRLPARVLTLQRPRERIRTATTLQISGPKTAAAALTV